MNPVWVLLVLRRYSVQRLFNRRIGLFSEVRRRHRIQGCPANHISVHRLTSLSPTFYGTASDPRGGLASGTVGSD